jgi:hypothetical protein
MGAEEREVYDLTTLHAHDPDDPKRSYYTHTRVDYHTRTLFVDQLIVHLYSIHLISRIMHPYPLLRAGLPSPG